MYMYNYVQLINLYSYKYSHVEHYRTSINMLSQASCDILQSHPRELQSQHGDISSKTCRSISSQRISPTPNFVQPLLTRACKYAAACALTAGLVLRKRATMAISKESKKAFLDQELDMQHGCTSMKWGSIETYLLKRGSPTWTWHNRLMSFAKAPPI